VNERNGEIISRFGYDAMAGHHLARSAHIE